MDESIWFAIIFGGIIGLMLILLLIASIYEEWENKYNRTFNDLKINDRYRIKGVADPFNVSDKQIAVILNKETSTINKRHYVLFVCNKIKYSCEWYKFKKYWAPIPKNSHLKEYDIDTDISENYKDFRDEYNTKIIKEQNNISEWK